MSPYYKTLGYIDVDAFLQRKNGAISLDLVDAGMVRPISQRYNWQTDTSSEQVLLRSVLRRRSRAKVESMLIPQFINLTPETIAFGSC